MNNFISGYRLQDNTFSEAFFPDSRIRDHWVAFVNALDSMATGEFEKQVLNSRKILGKHGATYNLFAEGERQAKPWEMDLIPFLISAREWEFLEQGLIQRATLINTILKDLYSDQSLIRDGSLPAESILAFPGFLRPCVGLVKQDAPFVSIMAVDIARDAAGKWQVINDLTQTPRGLGFALENRLITSQVLSRIFHQNRVMRLAPFFITLKAHLSTLLAGRTDPEILMISSGSGNTNYFEQALLSRYLGYPMVESGDLSVRDNRVFVKMLEGLSPVDVLLRYVPDLDCDPIALRPGGVTGVPGLLQAAQQQSVAVANPPGAGLMETPVFSKFYSGLCRKLLNQDLMLPDLPAYWCKNTGEREEVLTGMENFFIRKYALHSSNRIFDGALLSPGERQDLAADIRFSPYAWFARKKQTFATTPSLGPDLGIRPQSFACRFFICADQNAFSVMPGGLALDTSNPSTMFSRRNMGMTKDIWVLSDHPVPQVSLLGGMDQATDIQRYTDLPSRAADNLLWLGRHLENAETSIRLFRAIFMRLSGEIPYLEMAELPLLFSIASRMGMITEERMKENQMLSLTPMQDELLKAVYDADRPNGLCAVFADINTTATRVRDRLSRDFWPILSRLDLSGHETNPVQWIEVSNTYDLLDDLLVTLSAFSGLVMENTTRSTTWRFVDMGKRLVRAREILATISTAISPPPNDLPLALETLLELADSSMTYRFRYRTRLRTAPVMDLLLFDELNPRSLAFQLAALSRHVEHLPREQDRRYASQEEKILLKMMTSVRLTDPGDICEPDMTGERPKLMALIRETEQGLADFSQLITQHYLSRIPTTRHFSSLEIGERP